MFKFRKSKKDEIKPLVAVEKIKTLKGKIPLTNSKYILKNAYSADHITADICDDLGYFYLVPIKPRFVQQGKIFIKIKDEVYLFAVDESKIKTSKSLGSKGIRKLYYSTKNIQPLDFSDLADIEEFRKNNPGIKQIESIHAVLVMVCNEFNIKNGNESNENIKSVSMEDAINQYMINYTNNNSEDPKTVKLQQDLRLASKDFGSKNMVLPLNPVSSFLSATVQTSPINIMAIISSLEKKWFEWRKIANPNKKPFQHWILLIGLLGFLAVIGVVGFVLTGGAEQVSLIDQIEELNNSGITQDNFLDTVLNDPAAGLFDSVSDGFDDIITPDPEPETAPAVTATETNVDNTLVIVPDVIAPDVIAPEKVSTVFNGTGGGTVIPTENTAADIAVTVDTVDTNNTVDTVDTNNTENTIETIQPSSLTFDDKLDLAIQINGKDFTDTQIEFFKMNPDFLDSFIAGE